MRTSASREHHRGQLFNKIKVFWSMKFDLVVALIDIYAYEFHNTIFELPNYVELFNPEPPNYVELAKYPSRPT